MINHPLRSLTCATSLGRASHALRANLKLTDRKTGAVFVPIGRDGGEKACPRGALPLAGWFTLIDGMPMRRDEIRRAGKRGE